MGKLKSDDRLRIEYLALQKNLADLLMLANEEIDLPDEAFDEIRDQLKQLRTRALLKGIQL